MITHTVHVITKPSEHDRFVAAARALRDASVSEEGNIEYSLWAPLEGGHEVLVVERWRDQAAVEAPSGGRAHGRVPGGGQGSGGGRADVHPRGGRGRPPRDRRAGKGLTVRRYLKQAATAAGAFTADPDVASVVSDVIADVREHGDAAVRAYSEKFDHWSPADFRLSPEEISAIVAPR